MTDTPTAPNPQPVADLVQVELVAGPACGQLVLTPRSASKIYVTHLGRTETYWIVGAYKAHWSGWNTQTP